MAKLLTVKKTKVPIKNAPKLQLHDIRFDVKYGKTLLEKDNIPALESYFKQFFFKHNTKIFYFNGSTFDLHEQSDAIKLIPNDFILNKMVADEATKKFKKEEYDAKHFLRSTEFMSKEYTPTIDFSKPLTFSEVKTVRGGLKQTINNINMAKPMGIDPDAPPVVMTDYIKEGLEMIYWHIENILCSKDLKAYQYTLNWIASTLAGKKLRKYLYLQSALERAGKGQIIQLLLYILGDRMLKTSSVEVLTTYTKQLEGCALVNFDELPADNGNWKSIQDKLKGLITESTFDCRTMYSAGYVQKNTFNVIISTNNNAVYMTQGNMARPVVLDISEEKVGDLEYHTKLAKYIENPDIQLAFYQQMMEKFAGLGAWNADEEIITASKTMKIIEALPCFYKYIKEKYVLKNKGIDIKTNTFFDTYFKSTNDKTSKQQIGKYFKKLGIEPKKIAQTDYVKQHYIYYIKNTDLYNAFMKNKWIDALVDVVNDENNEVVQVESEEGGDEEEESAPIADGDDNEKCSCPLPPFEADGQDKCSFMYSTGECECPSWGNEPFCEKHKKAVPSEGSSEKDKQIELLQQEILSLKQQLAAEKTPRAPLLFFAKDFFTTTQAKPKSITKKQNLPELVITEVEPPEVHQKVNPEWQKLRNQITELENKGTDASLLWGQLKKINKLCAITIKREDSTVKKQKPSLWDEIEEEEKAAKQQPKEELITVESSSDEEEEEKEENLDNEDYENEEQTESVEIDMDDDFDYKPATPTKTNKTKKAPITKKLTRDSFDDLLNISF
jgi:Family of unknown function (DUF5906)